MSAIIAGAYAFMLTVALALLFLVALAVLAFRLAWAVWRRP